MSDQTFGKAARDYWDDLERADQMRRDAKEAALEALRFDLATVIHNSWSIEPFEPKRHTEDFATADAVIAAFPHIAE